MSHLFEDIVRAKEAELRRAKEMEKLVDLKARVKGVPPVRDFLDAVRRKETVNIIAEFKRASPIKGEFQKVPNPVAVARAYQQGGASAISVLTDAPFFKGSLEDLQDIRRAVELPVLRKDFIIDEYQIWESRAWLSDAVLLIARLLDPSQLVEYLDLARELALAALVEVHDERDLEEALDARASLIGINNRDLDTFAVDLSVTARLRPAIEDRAVVVSESGIHRQEDMILLGHMGVDAALIGEELMTSADPIRKLKELRGAA